MKSNLAFVFMYNHKYPFHILLIMFYCLYFILCSVGMKRWMEILGSAVCFTREKYGGKWRGQDVFYPTHQIQSSQIGEKCDENRDTKKHWWFCHLPISNVSLNLNINGSIASQSQSKKPHQSNQKKIVWNKILDQDGSRYQVVENWLEFSSWVRQIYPLKYVSTRYLKPLWDQLSSK